MKLSRCQMVNIFFKNSVCKGMQASYLIQTNSFTSRCQSGCQLISFSTMCALFLSWRFLIENVFNFLQVFYFEEKSPFAAYKTALSES